MKNKEFYKFSIVDKNNIIDLMAKKKNDIFKVLEMTYLNNNIKIKDSFTISDNFINFKTREQILYYEIIYFEKIVCEECFCNDSNNYNLFYKEYLCGICNLKLNNLRFSGFK